MGILSFFTSITVASVLALPSGTGPASLLDSSPSSETPQRETKQMVASRGSTRVAVLAARSWSRINVRTQPTTQSLARHYGYPGDRVQILDEAPGTHDSYTWYRVKFEVSGAEGWVREDLVYISDSRSEESYEEPSDRVLIAPEPEEDNATDETPERSRPAIDPGDGQTPRHYTQEEISFFLDIAMGAEYGNVTPVIRKWKQDIKVRVNGSPTAEDERTIRTVVNELNELLDDADPNSIDIEIVSGSRATPNVEIFIVPHAQFRQYEPNYVPGNLGFAWPRWRRDEIYTSKIYVTSTDITQRERSHLIREEFTQSLGLMRDTTNDRYINSIFYQWWTDTTAYTDLDRTTIAMLYRPDIEVGMTSSRVAGILSGATTTAAVRNHDKGDRSIFDRFLGAIGID